MALQKLGPYRLVRLIGQGGMGAVYEGIDERDGKRVAVKALPSAKSNDEVFARRFESEIATLIPLDHPNIVHILGHGRDQGHLFLAMELVEGPSLYEYYRKKRTLSWAEVVGYVLDVCKGLKFAHDRGFIHRDLKLGNLLLDPKGRVKLTDFGIARYGGVERDDLREAITAPGGVVGTLDYMAPEQLRGEPATIRSDLYSLGVVMYVLLSGRTPFAFKNVADAIVTLRTAEVTPIGTLVPDLPPRLERVVMRLLERAPQSRYGSAEAVARRLNEIIEGDSDFHPKNPGAAESVDGADEPDPIDDEFRLADDEIHLQRTEVGPPPAARRPPEDRQPTDPSPPIPVAPAPIGEPREPRTGKATLADPRAATSTGQRTRGDYFATVTDEERHADSWRTETVSTGPIWPYIVALITVLLLMFVGLWAVLYRRPSADRMHEQIASAIAEGRSPAELEEVLGRFVEMYPDDPRTAPLRHALDELDAERLPRRLERDLRWRGPEALTENERLLLDALRLSETRPDEADRRLAALDELISIRPDAQTEGIRDAIRVRRRGLGEVLATQLDQRRAEIATVIDEAKGTDPAEVEPAEVDQVRRRIDALLVFYRDDPRLVGEMQQLRQLRDALPSGSPEMP
ncbi:MAG TPA: serine/threonine-protein kinase [Pirellulaceae bacterium]|nr:serine/threonine-protein kinase [Pirellulaceae bacterium]